MLFEYIILVCLSGHPQEDLAKTEYLKQNHHSQAITIDEKECYYTTFDESPLAYQIDIGLKIT